ncbi:putative disease resistance protein [Vitis vinifera]|uniref:Putative disease resistance protein n=1 Tax=Vitis vinifera TaxID=29760 RepID=A0A438GX15_VITVI|nr:putative disease resistance protein [Vitis vinifera]
MEAQKKQKVECLTEEEAINLFKEKVGETTLNSHPDIPQLAETAAKECEGLPLALITIGRAMVGKSTPQEWERAILMLQTYPSKFSEDHEIWNEELIFLWIGEGFLDEFVSIDEALNQGHHIIEHLKTVCLFENPEFDRVKMHDVIRDMALWNGGLETFPSGFFSFMPVIKVLDLSNTGITKLPTGIECYEEFTPSNLEGMSILQLPRIKHLRTLIIYRCGELQDIKVNLENERGRQGFVADYIPNSIFYNLLRVHVDQLPKLLDLTWLIYIPSLEHLLVHECESMEEVIGDASGVPENLGIFSRLKHLCLYFVPNLRSISRRALSFPSLKTLYVRECPNLRKLPFDSNSARNSLKIIEGKLEWWQGLRWEDETIQLTFTPYFNK